MKEYSIASIAGDGIGKEVVPEAQKILKEISQQHQFKLNIEEIMILHHVIIMKSMEK